MFEQRVPMFEQLVQTAIQTILVQHFQRQAQQFIQRGARPPLPVQAPLAPRVQQPVNRQHLQDALPIRAFATGAQALTPKGVQVQLLPQLTRDPASAPVARTLQSEFAQANLHRVGDVCGDRALQRKQRQLSEGLAIGIEDFGALDPGGLLAVVDFAQVENRPLHPLAVRAGDFFDQAPVTVILAVFETVVRVEKGLAHFDGGHFTSAARWVGRG